MYELRKSVLLFFNLGRMCLQSAANEGVQGSKPETDE